MLFTIQHNVNILSRSASKCFFYRDKTKAHFGRNASPASNCRQCLALMTSRNGGHIWWHKFCHPTWLPSRERFRSLQIARIKQLSHHCTTTLLMCLIPSCQGYTSTPSSRICLLHNDPVVCSHVISCVLFSSLVYGGGCIFPRALFLLCLDYANWCCKQDVYVCVRDGHKQPKWVGLQPAIKNILFYVGL